MFIVLVLILFDWNCMRHKPVPKTSPSSEAMKMCGVEYWEADTNLTWELKWVTLNMKNVNEQCINFTLG